MQSNSSARFAMKDTREARKYLYPVPLYFAECNAPLFCGTPVGLSVLSEGEIGRARGRCSDG